MLLVDAMDWDLTYKDLITKIVSNPESNKCMMHRCESCLALQFWMNFLIRNSTNMKMIKNLIENHYSSLRRIQEILIDAIDDLARYSYIAKCQAQYLKWQKRHLEKIKPLLLGILVKIASFWYRTKFTTTTGVKNAASYIPCLYTSWEQMVASNMIHCVLFLMTATMMQAFYIKFKQCLSIILKLISHIKKLI